MRLRRYWRPPFPADRQGERHEQQGDSQRKQFRGADSLIPDWLLLSLIVMAGSAGYTLLAYLLWLWAS